MRGLVFKEELYKRQRREEEEEIQQKLVETLLSYKRTGVHT